MKCKECESWRCSTCRNDLALARKVTREKMAAEVLARFDAIISLYPALEGWLEYEADGRQYEDSEDEGR